MDNFVFNATEKYFYTLGFTGYMQQKNVNSLLVLLFYHRLIYEDYRGYVSKDDYSTIERALNCLYGTSCLIPYPDYLKMGKLKLGEMAEMLDRVEAIESYAEELNQRVKDNNVLTVDNIRRLDEHGNRLDVIENIKVVKGKNFIQDIPDIDLNHLTS